jgi:hypothetical protein
LREATENPVAETLRSLKRNNFCTRYVDDRAAAGDAVRDLIPVGSTVGIGDSVSVRQLGVIEELEEHGRIVVNPFSKPISDAINADQITDERSGRIDRLALQCEFFLTGTNVLTKDGKLLNVDGAGNRVVGQMFGPERVLIVAGVNKIVEDLEAGFKRIKNVIAPQHAKMKRRDTPCVEAGRCVDCSSPERICNVTGIIEKNPSLTDITIILVNEDLGLGWDFEWAEERIENLRSDYESLTWLIKPGWSDQRR